MNWTSQIEPHYVDSIFPYTTTGSFMEYIEGITYDHVNYIFSGTSYAQDSIFPPVNMNSYKFGLSEPGTTSYYNSVHGYDADDHHVPRIEDYRRPFANSATVSNEPSPVASTRWEGNASMVATHASSVECPRSHDAHEHQVVWQDNIDPDNMTYEELLELGEAVGTQSRGLTKAQIALLPTSKFKCGFFSRRKSLKERCVICQMEYKRGDRLMKLPCKHAYHTCCGSQWLSINKACPICYTDVFGKGTNK